jgi:transcriptional regulator with XRE-family HTH domain
VIQGRHIVAGRALADLTQKELAQQAGINVDTLRRIEASGKQSVSCKAETLNRLLVELGKFNVVVSDRTLILNEPKND